MTTCAHCETPIHQEADKAPGDGWAVVWADPNGVWVCPSTGDEHAPATEEEMTRVCEECGNDDAAEGSTMCTDCLEATTTEEMNR